MSSPSVVIDRPVPAPFGPGDHLPSLSVPPFRLQACWQPTVYGDGPARLVCRWVLVPA